MAERAKWERPRAAVLQRARLSTEPRRCRLHLAQACQDSVRLLPFDSAQANNPTDLAAHNSRAPPPGRIRPFDLRPLARARATGKHPDLRRFGHRKTGAYPPEPGTRRCERSAAEAFGVQPVLPAVIDDRKAARRLGRNMQQASKQIVGGILLRHDHQREDVLYRTLTLILRTLVRAAIGQGNFPAIPNSELGEESR